MGTNYETVLVAAGLESVRDVVAAAGSVAALVSVASERTAVIPREVDGRGYAETRDLAVRLSRDLGCPVVTFEVADSDVLLAHVYRDGARVHEYLSNQSILVNVLEDTDGEFKKELRGVVYPLDAELPGGPVGADPEVFVPFGVGQMDLAGLAEGLNTPQLFAERQHWDILSALNLDPRGLTIAYRHLDHAELAGVYRVGLSP